MIFSHDARDRRDGAGWVNIRNREPSNHTQGFFLSELPKVREHVTFESAQSKVSVTGLNYATYFDHDIERPSQCILVPLALLCTPFVKFSLQP